MMAQRLRRWAIIKLTLGQHLVLARTCTCNTDSQVLLQSIIVICPDSLPDITSVCQLNNYIKNSIYLIIIQFQF